MVSWLATTFIKDIFWIFPLPDWEGLEGNQPEPAPRFNPHPSLPRQGSWGLSNMVFWFLDAPYYKLNKLFKEQNPGNGHGLTPQ
jgi:hypothetical protein